MTLEWFGMTTVGRRSSNQDAFCGRPDCGLFAVADGMGGYKGGEVASQLAISAVDHFFERVAQDAESTWPLTPTRSDMGEGMVEVALRWAHERVQSERTGERSEMGSTLSMLVLTAQRMVVGHIGDSRIYRLRKGKLEQLTRDHSLYEDLKATGAQVPPIEEFPYPNVITRALGLGSATPEVRTFEVRRKDTYLLCTDGLTGPLSAGDLRGWLSKGPIERACRGLLRAAYEAGSKDNITALVVRIKRL